MAELIRDTCFGHLVRFATGNKYLRYQEEINPELWKRYVNVEKSGNMAKHGQTTVPDEAKDQDADVPAESETSSESRIPSDENHVHNEKIDPEVGRDVHIVDWWGPNDPEVCRLVVFGATLTI